MHLYADLADQNNVLRPQVEQTITCAASRGSANVADLRADDIPAQQLTSLASEIHRRTANYGKQVQRRLRLRNMSFICSNYDCRKVGLGEI